jgi:hypothetical protein
MANINFIIHNLFPFVHKNNGSSFVSPAHGCGGARATIEFNNSPSAKKLGEARKQAGKKEGGLGEGIFARLPKRSPAALLVQSRAQQKSFLFLLEEKIGRAQIKKSEENFFAGWRASASGGGAERQFRSKKVRAFSNKGHQTGLPDFLEAKAIVCSPRLRARLARNEAVKSNGGAKSQETIFSEMRRFVPIFCAK